MKEEEEVTKYLESKKNVEILYQMIYDFLDNYEVTVWDLFGCLEQIKLEQFIPNEEE